MQTARPLAPRGIVTKPSAKKYDALRGLTPQQVDELYGWLLPKTVQANEYVFHEGESPDGMYLLMTGHVVIVKESGRGKFRLAELEAPNYFGEMALLSPGPRSASARAVRESTLGFLPAATFNQKLANNNLVAFRIALNVGKLLAERMRETNTTLSRKAAISMRMKWG